MLSCHGRERKVNGANCGGVSIGESELTGGNMVLMNNRTIKSSWGRF